MGATTVMGVIMIVWCLVTLAVQPEKRHLPADRRPTSRRRSTPRASRSSTRSASRSTRSGFIGETALGEALRPERITGNWWSLIGVIGILIAFGHSILAMSGEETLAQVYREVESAQAARTSRRRPSSSSSTACSSPSRISFLAVMIIPDDVRMTQYGDNLIGGLAMNVVGPAVGAAAAQRASSSSSAS